MPVSTLVSNVRRILEGLRVTHGPFVLAMLYSSSEEEGTGWNLIISAPWADQAGVDAATSEVIHALSLDLSLENRSAIARVTVLPTSDPFVREVTSNFNVSSPGAEQAVRNFTADGVPVGSGHIFFSQQLTPA